jgi:phosphoribosylcarboxyaminoimidazole (NCAIR) mutase
MTDLLALPPNPVQVIENVLLAAVNGPVAALPDTGLAPTQLPLNGSAVAAQEFEFDADHVSVALPPLVTVVGLAVSDTVGEAGVLTMTVRDFDTAPPAPVHVSE